MAPTIIQAPAMKFEDYLMQQGDESNRKMLDLEAEVEKLQVQLHEEEEINKVLHLALHGPVSSHLSDTLLLPPQVQGLVAELAMVEEEIIWLERKVNELKLSLYQERKQMKEWKTQQQQQQRKMRRQNHLPPCVPSSRSVLDTESKHLSRSQHYEDFRKEKTKLRRASVGSAAEMLSMVSAEEGKTRRRRGKTKNESLVCKEILEEKPNEISEELIKCIIAIFFDLNKRQHDREGTASVPKLGLSCMKSKGRKTPFNCKASMFTFNNNLSNLDPYRIMPDLDSTVRDIGPYKNYIQINNNSIDIGQLSESSSLTTKLRVLMHKLGNIDLAALTYKQKLAFWINIYNACVMNAFLQQGLTSSQDGLLDIMNKAQVNIGGVVLNALAIEHFILRHPSGGENSLADEKEMLLRHTYGLGYPEPNVTFALCRGSWSSPALRIYTPDEVINELGRAKVEYLEASVGVTSKRKIVVPMLLQWHMQDFADDMESLLEWIYSQLPRHASLKRLMIQCLNGDAKSSTNKIVEIQPYESKFRYLLPI